MPSYNAEKTIERSLSSICRQTRGNYQIVLVDDGSTDATPDICENYSRKDPRILVVHQSNKGLMGAWKKGVCEAKGDYVAFCDSDDYLDEDFIERIDRVIDDYSPDLIVYGLKSEYSNGETIELHNRLSAGYYSQSKISSDILPKLFSDGSAQSEIIIKSRWSKVYKKSILLRIMPDLNDRISLGEDQLTMFATMQTIKSLYCMGEYSPYHYVRHSDSMIGHFDRKVFEKLDRFYKEMDTIADKYSYLYPDQILYDRLSVTLLYIKKYICRSTDKYIRTRDIMKSVRESTYFRKCLERCSVNGYDIRTKLFARLFIMRGYYVLYTVTKLFEMKRGRDV